MYNERIIINDILACKEIVQQYEKEIKDFLLQNEESAELLLTQYAQQKEILTRNSYFPVSLDLKDKLNILRKYIDSENVNPNYLKLIFESQSSSDLFIDDKLKLKAKRKYDSWMNSLFEESSGIAWETKVSFSKKQEEVKKVKFLNREVHLSYDEKWIIENSDNATILNNFIYLFEFTDAQFRIQHVNKPNNVSSLEKALGIKGKKEYFTGGVFNQIQCMAMLQMIGYCDALKRSDIRIEKVLEWFFNHYLENEFGIKGFYLHLSSEKSTYLEKCRTIISEIDSILKQFRLFVQEGEIDSELLQISSEHIIFNSIPSLMENKYLYPCSKEYDNASFYLFSDQSSLHYLSSTGRGYKSFSELLVKENLKVQDFENHQRPAIEWLMERDYISSDKEGFIRNNMRKVWVIKELFDNEVLCTSYIKSIKSLIKELVKKNVLEYGTSLLSKPEQDYFNYILNKAEFSNGLDLRNRYVHGTQPIDEKSHEQDYFTLLRLLVLLVIKINEEFCIADEEDLLNQR